MCLLNPWLWRLGHFIEAALLEGSNYREWQVRFSALVNNAVENTEVPLAPPGMKKMNRGNGKQPPEMAAASGHEHSTRFFKKNFIFLFIKRNTS